MADRVKIILNGKKIEAVEREALIDVCAREGVHIPTLCHHPSLEPYGACRVCIAKAIWGGKSKYITACNYPVEDGDIFDTESDDVISLRNMSIESLLGRCPNEKGIVEFAGKYGITESRFPPEKPGGDDCILCGLCVRVCDEIVMAHALGFMGRGTEREVATPMMVHPDSCIGCGACSALCPTSRMKMELEKTGILIDRHGDARPCRFTLMGYFPGGICANSYRCYRCDVDQKYRELTGDEHPIFTARATSAGGDRA